MSYPPTNPRDERPPLGASDAAFGQRLLEAFEAVADLAPSERADALQTLEAESPDLARALRALLARDERTGPLDHTLSAQIQPLLREALPELDPSPAHIGPYAVLRLLGEGGMGRVYLARRSDGPVARDVAIKLIRPDRAGAGLLARFEAERRHLAALDHPGICRFIDADSLADGTPYVVMEAVEGEPIIDYCHRHSLGLRARVELLRKLLAAVAHAHDRLLLHRDIKPHNVLVTAEGQPKLLDFGIAKSIEDAQASVTRTAERFFTPNASPPEQLLGQPAGVASDVYSLGALAYELLSGALPFEFKDLRAAEIERLILQVAPPLMSERSAHAWARELRGDLDAIIATCLCKAPSERYRNVDALDAELQRYLQGRPVTARAPTWVYRARLFVKRHRVGTALTGTLAAAITASAAALALQAQELRGQRNLAIVERNRALEVVNILESAFRNADPSKGSGDTVSARQILDAAVPSIDAIEHSRPEVFARLAATLAKVELDLAQSLRATNWVERGLQAVEHSRSPPEVTQSLLFTGAMAWAREGKVEKAALAVEKMREAGMSGSPELTLASARLMMLNGQREEAAAALLSTSDGLIEAGAGPDSFMANEMRWLAATALSWDQSERAIEVLSSTLVWQQGELEDDHPWILKTRMSLLNERSFLSPSMEIADEQEELIAKLKSKFGEQSPLAGTASDNRGSTLYALGKYQEAASEYAAGYEVLSRARGPEHLATIRIGLNLMAALATTGTTENLLEARTLASEVFENSVRAFGPLAPISMTAQIRFAEIHMALGNWNDAVHVMSDQRMMGSYDGTSARDLRAQLASLKRLLAASICSARSETVPRPCAIIVQKAAQIERVLLDSDPRAHY